MGYSPERKTAVLKRMFPPNNLPLRQLSQDEGISEATLHKWRAQARGNGQLLPDAAVGPEGWTSRDKFAAVLETAAMNEADMAEYCRKRGLFPEQIKTWRGACEQANDWDRASTARMSQATREEKKRIKDLERDLARKDRALAETAALLVLRKKAAAIWGGRRGRMISTPHRQTAVTLIQEAVTSGARRFKGCAELEISARTLRRWMHDGQVCADQRPLVQRSEPRNKLSAQERAAVLSICNSTEFASLPPSQIVPKLADQGQYLASESSFYRILRAQGQQHHRGRARPSVRRKPPTSYKAVGPCEVWTWDITWMPGPVAGMFFYLYLIVDIFSRKIVGWEVHEREAAELAATLIQKAVWSEACISRPLVLHADNGSPMKGATMKAEAQAWVKSFVNWYNDEHLHSAIRFVTPNTRHGRCLLYTSPSPRDGLLSR